MLKYEIISDSGNAVVNEDLATVYNNSIWLFDGATPLNNELRFENYESSSEWLVKEFNKELISNINLETDFTKALEKSINNIIQNNKNLLSLNKYMLPSFTFAAINIVGDMLNMYYLADCVIYLHFNNGNILRVTDNRYDKYEEYLINKWLEVEEMELEEQEKNNKFNQYRIETMQDKNIENGYWVASLDNTWIKNILNGKCNLSDVDKFLICSDGFERIFGLYKFCQVEDVFSDKISLSECLKNIRQIEIDDVKHKKYPRIKRADDATVIYGVLDKSK